jgi:two-component system, NarL family, response regulator NreC
MQQQKIGVMTASDHPIMRDGLRLCIQKEPDMWLVCETGDLAQLRRELKACRPQVVVIDLSPRDAGIRAMDAVRHLSPKMPLVVIVSEVEEYHEAHAPRGATVFISRIRASREIIAAIRAVAAQAQRTGRADPP